ncbi:Serine/threonine-protein kinase wnk3 [Asimina triloba]
MGIKPASLGKVKDRGVKEFIEKCIANVSERLSARELLMHPFLQTREGNEFSVHSPSDSKESDDSFGYADRSNSSSGFRDVHEASRDFKVKGQRKDVNTIFLKLRIADSTDTAISVASEMVAELDLTDQDVTTIASMIDLEIQALVPEWIPGESFEDNFGEETVDYTSDTKDEVYALENDLDHPSGSFVLERLPSGRRFWSDSPKAPLQPTMSNLSSEVYFPASDTYSGEFSVDNSGNQEESVGVSLPYQEKYYAASSEKSTQNCASSEHFEWKNAPSDDSDFHENVHYKNRGVVKQHDANHSSFSAGANNQILMDSDTDEVKAIVEKLEQLLVEQQIELNYLKKKHQLVIADLLKELPNQVHSRVVKMCGFKFPDYKMQNEMRWYSTDSGSFLHSKALSPHSSKAPVSRVDDFSSSATADCPSDSTAKQARQS